MCGIAGVYSSNQSAAESKFIVKNMLKSIEHRGPDASGIVQRDNVALGHNRLSIIDLSHESNQPFEYNNLILTYNGEIYNYVELKDILIKNGYQFRTNSDTEVVCAAYHFWGDDCVNHFVGMWAFAIYDSNNRTLFCSRDRFGIKPFVYTFDGSSLYFASEYKALKRTPKFDNSLNTDMIAMGLNLGWVSYGEDTYFKTIKNLEAGTNLYFDGKSIFKHRYWDIHDTGKQHLEAGEASEIFAQLFSESVKLQLRSDVKLGACLSGGLDSSSILSTVAKCHKNNTYDAYTIFYEGEGAVDEREWAEEVVKKYENIKWLTLSPSDNDILEAFEKTHFHADVPLAGSSYISQYFVMKLASKNATKVLLDGQGSDEYLAGYMHSFDRLIGLNFSKLQLTKAFKNTAWHYKRHKLSFGELGYLLGKSVISGLKTEHDFYKYAFRHKVENVLTGFDKRVPFSINHDFFSSNFDQYLYNLLFTTSLPSLLHFEDRNSMAFSIESRVPFLDHRLVEFVFNLDNHHKIDRGETKKILRNSMVGVLPEKIRMRQDKKGFVTPGEERWLRGPLKPLLNVDFSNFDFIDGKKAKKVVDEFVKGKPGSQLAWRLVSLNYWLKKV